MGALIKYILVSLVVSYLMRVIFFPQKSPPPKAPPPPPKKKPMSEKLGEFTDYEEIKD